MKNDMLRCAKIALKQCLNLNRQEQLLVVCDEPCIEVGRAFWETGAALCREAVMVQITPRKQNGNEPPPAVGSMFDRFDVAVMPTSKSLSHTQARRLACERGTRIATLPGITEEVFLRTMDADWDKLGVLTRRIAGQLSSVKTIRVMSDAGTDITFETGGRAAKPDDGRLIYKGAFGNLPAGEAYLAPLEDTANGVIAVDGSFALGGLCEQPLVLIVRKGKVVEIKPHPVADELQGLFEKYGAPARNIAEFGVGTLSSAIISGNTLEDEKVKGTIHFAVGDNASMGGTVKVPLHLDGIIKQPNVWLDGVLWMDKGGVE
ncbi:MAG TPA: aminopeptidase [Chitinivibrionales bacterium]